MSNENKAKGGHARAEKLSPEKRSDIARKAAEARWSGDMPVASHEGTFPLGTMEVSCAVLPNGKRLITQGTFLRALGRSRSPKGGTGVLSTVDGTPFFLQAEAFKPFINKDLLESTTPIFYRTKDGSKDVGYDAAILPMVAEVYLKYRDAAQLERGIVEMRYQKMVAAADVLIRGLAQVGIIALVDEATGYQRDRARDALQQILEKFIAKELRPWVHTFPDEFYTNLFRIRKLDASDITKRPSYFGHLTNNIVYARLAPTVLDELKKMTPKRQDGSLKHHLHRRLSADTGHPKLREHLASVISLMKISDEYDDFMRFLDRAHPRFNETLALPLIEADAAIASSASSLPNEPGQP